MESKFWHQRWAEKKIGFHQPEVNADLISHWSTLDPPAQGRVLVPLCGKSLDMVWLIQQGHHVVGLELSELAVREFFVELEVEPEVETKDRFKIFRADNLTILCGDFFEATPDDLGGVDTVYDRAALVAMPPEMRQQYADQLKRLMPDQVPMLLLTFQYTSEEVQGPPFSVDQDIVTKLYQDRFEIDVLDRHAIDLRGAQADELVFRLTAR